MENLKITDGREFGYFRIDNNFILKYGAVLSPSSISVYCVLALCADNKTREAWPSIRKIAEILDMSSTTVTRAINELEKHGIIVQTGLRGRVAHYTLVDLKKKKSVSKNNTLMVQNTNKSELSTGVSIFDTGVPNSDTPLYQFFDDLNLPNKTHRTRPTNNITKTVVEKKLISFLQTQPSVRDPQAFLASLKRDYGDTHLEKLLTLEFSRWREHLDHWARRGR